jgi:N-acetylglutamate synthase-like GNAT family acetyltransferase
MSKNIKDFALENGDTMLAIIFFVITMLIFIVAAVHIFKMKRATLDEIANLAIKPDTEKNNGSE